MNMSVWRRGGVSLIAVAVLAGAAGCQGDGEGKASGASRKDADQQSSGRTPTQVIAAAFKKTEAAKSAKVRMTMSMPGIGGDNGETVMSGVMGWNPTVMDMTTTGPLSVSAPGVPKKVRMIWRDDVMYMDMGSKAGKETDGKRWMKLDLAAAAKASGDEKLAQRMTGSLDGMNQDPAKQLATLLESPNIRHVGTQKVDGEQAEHYKGTLTVEDMVNADKSQLGEKERQELLKTMRKSKIKGYDTEVWVNEDDLPVKMVLGMKTPQGSLTVKTHYYDYGAPVTVEAPPAAETFDVFSMLKDRGTEAGEPQL
ncbi:hypothetical protein [Streptomyces sp. 8N706]|uniref:hypothetical protein n=1 Tax=Streptomyces sp. 8N706 TaxID=3457416 RepID=UPI003FCF528F